MIKIGLFILFIVLIRFLYKSIFIVKTNHETYNDNSKEQDIIDVDYEEIE